MKCPNCKKQIIIPRRVYLNLDTYNVGGTALTISECCNTAFNVEMIISYKTTLYEGNKSEDDWGNKIKND